MTTNKAEHERAELIEKLAAVEHERWADWQRWCNKVLRENNPSHEQGDVLERWDRQIETPYAELSEKEKQSDRDQVMRYWPLLADFIAKEVATKDALNSAERAELEMYRRQHAISLEDYHEFGKAPAGSPERMVAYVSYLSLHNLPRGAETLKEWRDAAVAKEVAAAHEDAVSTIYSIANDLAARDPKAIGSVSLAPYFANALTIYSEFLKGDNYERIDWRGLDLPTLNQLAPYKEHPASGGGEEL